MSYVKILVPKRKIVGIDGRERVVIRVKWWGWPIIILKAFMLEAKHSRGLGELAKSLRYSIKAAKAIHERLERDNAETCRLAMSSRSQPKHGRQ